MMQKSCPSLSLFGALLVLPIRAQESAGSALRSALRAENLTYAAWRATNTGDVANAVRLAKESTSCNRSDGYAWATLGRALLASNQFHDAAIAFQQAIDINPISPWYCFAGLVNALAFDKDWSRANAAALLAAKTFPTQLLFTDKPILFTQAQQSRYLGMTMQLVREYPKEPLAYILAAGAVDMEGDATRTAQLATQAIEADGDHVLALAVRGRLRRIAGDVEGAIADRTKAIQLRAPFASPYSAMAYATMDSSPRDSIRYADAALPHLVPQPYDSHRAWILQLKAHALYVDGHTEAAMVAITESHLAYGLHRNVFLPLGVEENFDDWVKGLTPHNEQDVIYWYLRGVAAQSIAKNSDAQDQFNKCVEVAPQWGMGYLCRAQVRERIGDIRGAIDDYSTASRLEPRLFCAWSGLARLAASWGKEAKASEAYAKMVEHCPDFPETLWWLAKVDYGAKEWELAIRRCSALLRISGDSEVFFLRSQARRAIRDFDGEITDLNLAIEAAPLASPPADALVARAKIRIGSQEVRSATADLIAARRASVPRTTSYEEAAALIQKHCLEHLCGICDGYGTRLGYGKCPTCTGTGYTGRDTICAQCLGAGSRRIPVPDGGDCERCGGSGLTRRSR